MLLYAGVYVVQQTTIDKLRKKGMTQVTVERFEGKKWLTFKTGTNWRLKAWQKLFQTECNRATTRTSKFAFEISAQFTGQTILPELPWRLVTFRSSAYMDKVSQ